uniref:Uncharacterized protein n=1 Tax=Oryza glumipatula TaxID=40148 RepID=A0A0E0AYJ5_9ORYZ
MDRGHWHLLQFELRFPPTCEEDTDHCLFFHPSKSTCIDRFISWGDKTRATHSDIATMCVSKTSK